MTIPSSTYVNQTYQGANIKKSIAYCNFDLMARINFKIYTLYNIKNFSSTIHTSELVNYVNFNNIPSSPNKINLVYSKINFSSNQGACKYSNIGYNVTYDQKIIANQFYPFPLSTLFSIDTGWTSPYALTSGVQFYSFWS